MKYAAFSVGVVCRTHAASRHRFRPNVSRMRDPFLPGGRGILSDGPMIGRLRVSTFVFNETRETVYDGSRREDNPLDERTSITVPIVMVDYRLATRVQRAVVHRDPADCAHRRPASDDRRCRVPRRGAGRGRYHHRRVPRRVAATLELDNQRGIVVADGADTRATLPGRNGLKAPCPPFAVPAGSGTVDPTFGLALERPLYGGRWVNSLAARLPVADNADGLRVGASSELSSGWAHIIRTHRVMGYGRVDWLHRQQDVFQGTPVLVGGGDWLYLTPGLAVMVGKGVNVQADVKLPMYRNLSNRQLDSHLIWQFGISRSF